jgi:hypothetical protein
MDKRGSAVVIRFRLYGVFLLEEQTNNANINSKFLFV